MDAYERLLTDAMAGEGMLFVREDAVDAAWAIVDPILGSAAPAIGELLDACPGLSVLATSRAPLGLRWERQVVVPPLELPGPRFDAALEVLAAVPSVALFVARARAADAAFALDAGNVAAVAEICVRLAGVPLAIELAAAASRSLSVEVVRAQLASPVGGLELLARRPRDAPARHQSLRSAIGWSYRLLTPTEQLLLGRLSVFAGSFDLDAAIEVGAVVDAGESLLRLVDHSLVQAARAPDPFPFRVLEAVRAYALRQLPPAAADEARRRHAEWLLRQAERAGPALKGPDQAQWFDFLEEKLGDCLLAIYWAIDAGEAALAPGLATALRDFWWMRGHVGEGRAALEAALARFPDAPEQLRAPALVVAGFVAGMGGDLPEAVSPLTAGLALARMTVQTELLGWGYLVLAFGYRYLGSPDEAEAALEEARPRLAAGGDPWYAAMTLQCRADLASDRGDRVQATFGRPPVRFRRESGRSEDPPSTPTRPSRTATGRGPIVRSGPAATAGQLPKESSRWS